MKTTTSHHLHSFSVYTNEYGNLLKPDKYKNIVVKHLRSFIEENNIALKAFVIIHSHINIMAQINCDNSADVLLNAFLKKITRPIIYDLQKNHPVILRRQKKYTQEIEGYFWNHEIDDLVIPDEFAYQQKLDYIHAGPVRAGLCEKPEDYMYSSAQYYGLNKDYFNWIAA